MQPKNMRFRRLRLIAPHNAVNTTSEISDPMKCRSLHARPAWVPSSLVYGAVDASAAAVLLLRHGTSCRFVPLRAIKLCHVLTSRLPCQLSDVPRVLVRQLSVLKKGISSTEIKGAERAKRNEKPGEKRPSAPSFLSSDPILSPLALSLSLSLSLSQRPT